MKRLAVLLITFILILSLCSCSSPGKGTYSDDYEYLWEELEDSYLYLSYLRDSKGIDIDDIRESYAERTAAAEDADAFSELLQNMFTEMENFCHLGLVTPETYKSYYNAYVLDESYSYNREPFAEILQDPGLSEIYVKPESAEDLESETALKAPEVWVQYFDDCETLYLRINSFQHELIGRDGPVIKAALDKYHGAKNLIIDITNNSGGSDMYWEQNLVAPLGGRYEFNYRDYFKSSDLTDRYYGELESFEVTTDAPDWVRELGLDRYFENNAVIPEGDAVITDKSDLKRWVLTSSRVYSASDKFVNFCRQTGWATVVGTVTGGDGLGSTPVLLKLPDSGLLVRFSALAGENQDGSMNAGGTAPDVICVKNEDPLDRCLELIGEAE